MTRRDEASAASGNPTTDGPRVWGVVLAAGMATRMGGSKVTRVLEGRPMVERVVDAALASRLAGTVVVVGHEADEVRRILHGRPVRVVENPLFAHGLSTSLHAGLRGIDSDCDAALFLLADQPFVTTELIDRLIDEHVASGRLIVRPEHGGRPANPVLFSARLFSELARETGDRGGRDVVRRHADEVALVPVDDPVLCVDIDSLEEYERLRAMNVQTDCPTLPRPRAVVRGGGDLATGAVLALHRAGISVVVTEVAQPTVVRRTVSFAEAVYAEVTDVEGIRAARAAVSDIDAVLDDGVVPVVVARSHTQVLEQVRPVLLVDAIMAKRNLGTRITDARAVVALGPGFVAGRDAHAVVETRRGHDLGRILYEGEAQANTGVPGEIGGYTWQRVIRSPAAGIFQAAATIGDPVQTGDVIGYVGETPVHAPLDGVLRGLLYTGLHVTEGFKMGDVDPRGGAPRCFTVSDKARAVGGSVLVAACALLGGVWFVRDAAAEN